MRITQEREAIIRSYIRLPRDQWPREEPHVCVAELLDEVEFLHRKLEENMSKQSEMEAHLYQMLNLMGIKVEKEKKLVDDPEPMIVVGTWHEPGAPTIKGTIQAVCSCCEEKVNIAPSSQVVIEQRKKLGHKVIIQCLTCLSKQTNN